MLVRWRGDIRGLVCFAGGVLCGNALSMAHTHKHVHARIHARACTHTRVCVHVGKLACFAGGVFMSRPASGLSAGERL